jgi:NAD+ synthase (glutamine-hydrolysing)
MKVAIAQIDVIPYRPNINFQKMSQIIAKAKTRADIIVFPELCIPGYLIGDAWEESSFIFDCEDYGEEIKNLSDELTIIFGNIAIDREFKNKDGRIRKYNALFCAHNKKYINWGKYPYYIKTLLPNYREFEEPRHFTPSTEVIKDKDYFNPKIIENVPIGMVICEDSWTIPNNYSIDPIEEYVKNGAELIINISASPYTLNKNKSRNKVFGEGHAKGKNIPIIYVNCVGIQNNAKTIFTFDGSSVAYNKFGEIIHKCPMFEEVLHYVEFDNKHGGKDFVRTNESNMIPEPSEIEEITMALEYGIKKYLDSCGIKRIVIGLSGGIDSALAALLYTRAVGAENVLLVNMPSENNSKTTINISDQIAEKLGCFYISIPIGPSVALTRKQIEGYLNKAGSDHIVTQTIELKLSSLDLENVQARDRSSRILAALSSVWKGVFTCNGNKSEMTVGYCTRYGDLGGFLAALGDLWKHDQIYPVARYLNDKCHVFPESLFTLPPSPELSPEHNVDEGKGDALTYWYHDRIFQGWQQDWNRKTPEDHLRAYLDNSINKMLGLEGPDGKLLDPAHDVYKFLPTVKKFTDDLERWYKLFKGMAVTKRVEAPPVLAISRRSFGYDYRETLNACYFTRKYYGLKSEALKK